MEAALPAGAQGMIFFEIFFDLLRLHKSGVHHPGELGIKLPDEIRHQREMGAPQNQGIRVGMAPRRLSQRLPQLLFDFFAVEITVLYQPCQPWRAPEESPALRGILRGYSADSIPIWR